MYALERKIKHKYVNISHLFTTNCFQWRLHILNIYTKTGNRREANNDADSSAAFDEYVQIEPTQL